MVQHTCWVYEGNGGDCLGPYSIDTPTDIKETIDTLNTHTDEVDFKPLTPEQENAIRKCIVGKYTGPDGGVDIEIIEEIAQCSLIVLDSTGIRYRILEYANVPTETINKIATTLDPYRQE